MRQSLFDRSCARRQRGAALLLAMVILTLVTTLAAGMVWQQWRAIQVETAERARSQSAWLLTGALDWARLILREDYKSDQLNSGARPPKPMTDDLGEAWATPLAEARLSSFLAADQSNNADDGGGLDAFISGGIEDAQSRYNLRNLAQEDKAKRAAELLVLEKLCATARVPADIAQRLSDGLLASAKQEDDAVLEPQKLEQLTWYGIDPAVIAQLAPWVTLLPPDAKDTKVNVNTAPREVLVAVVTGLDTVTAERLVQARQRKPFDGIAAVIAMLPTTPPLDTTRLSVTTNYFEVQGQIRIGDRALQEHSLVKRNGLTIDVLQRERVNIASGGG
jgi:general secretion pathway protein K